jgi:hypothetical protein
MSVMIEHTELELQLENSRYCGTGGVSSHSCGAGFRPAFMDSGTRAVYLSRFADGRMAPFHTLEGLPRELVLGRSASGRVAAIKPSVISGFVRAGVFYTRDEAAAFVAADRRFGEAGDGVFA